MHFSKTYSQLLSTLPPDLRDKAIEYRQLKKLINQVVVELTALGLSPETLQRILLESHVTTSAEYDPKGKSRESGPNPLSLIPSGPSEASSTEPPLFPRIVYELNTDSGEIEPRLRLWTSSNTQFLLDTTSQFVNPAHLEVLNDKPPSLAPCDVEVEVDSPPARSTLGEPSFAESRELVIPLPSDSAFFHSLIHATQTLSLFLMAIRKEFTQNMEDLARNISATAKPMSSKSSFHTYSSSTNPALVTIRSPASYFGSSKSDLSAWREVFQMYLESEVFESHGEQKRGERAVEDAEHRLGLFLRRLGERGLADGSGMKLQQSKQAMRMFLELNASILNLLKFQYATNEATRKILKKHTKRTALPINLVISSPFSIIEDAHQPSSSLIRTSSGNTTSLALILVQAIGQTIIPIVPDIDDYSCVICSDIAFKPIRLHCGHLFCVRCLVKMQKRGQANCPMCRAPTVLIANRSNVDWALLNFMRDWFPAEAKKKMEQNEKEAAKEEMEELGLNSSGCIIG
ncbi:hypothetical protein NLI96_g5739 [Meripilus lineatus]|uniref:RING-14 protein n=1 Tax=Meripilus lineatus TaxID=2056292 RepID=A0AAD5V489_9APHY|nr:hypothetical protein NLI96_g5739 [Physisporinus lineatus]